ncbi:MAG: aminopeptidase P N-terminal domain-containing protein [Cyanobacteria bacterium]|nr:aminopeptidase P N-terminal domain-containing protein [Cyanobacteriota bacterium]MDW8202531.1 aminopeptidase P N-terminal domain-containing protein [Cyanobacteriota bacterium SKYGB_h_bin112]
MQTEYQQRRQRMMEKIDQGTAIFRSAPMAIMHNDVEYNFRQDSDVYYLTGFEEPETVVVLAPHHQEHKFVLFVRPKDPEQETWTGTRVGVEAAKELYGADAVYSIAELDEKLPQYLEKADRIYYRLGHDEAFNAKVLKHWRQLIRTYPKTGVGPIALEDPILTLHSLRQVKSDAEIALMRKAADLAVEAHNLARTIARPGLYEYEIQAEIEHHFCKHGAGPAYPSIVASGANACILHYTHNRRQLQAGDLLLIDAGCTYQFYNSDITRTFPVSGKFTPEQKAIYEIVLRAQLAAIEQAQPGNPYAKLHETSVRVIVEGLMELGLLQGDIEEIIKEEKYKPFFMHRTGHWLGIDVHDVGVYAYGETPYNLQPGNVFTVEPGIYIAPDIKPAEGQPDVPDRWKGIGVRIEDDVLITPTGHEVLTAGVPKSVEAMER